MDPQTILPTSPSPFSNGRSTGPKPILFVLIAVLALGAIAFGALSIVFYNKANVATATLETQKAEAVAAARAEQQKADAIANTLALESPYRSYVAPVEYGSFEIKFPKSWSGYVIHEKIGTQVNLTVNPDFVRRSNSQDEPAAARIMLMQRSVDQYMSAYNSQLKRNLAKSEITVSGQKAVNLTGEFTDKKTVRQVIVPVRDKVLVFLTENKDYANQFNEILAQSKIIP